MKLKYSLGEHIRPEHLRWLWKGYIPANKLTILAGPGGLGKSTLTCDFAARVTTGADWPDNTEGGPPRKVVIYSSEDERDDTIIPRLMAANVDLKMIVFPDSLPDGSPEGIPFDPAKHLAHLREDLADIGDVGLVIVDSIVDCVDGEMNAANVVRKALYPWKDLASDLKLGVIGISHLAKTSAKDGRSITERVLGSGAFTQLARAVLIAGKSEQFDSRVLAKSKSNNGPDGGGIAYSIEGTKVSDKSNREPFETCKVVWGNLVSGSAEEIFRVLKDSEKQKPPKPAEIFLIKELPKGGETPAKSLIDLAFSRGISHDQLQHARKKLRITSRKGSDKAYYWSWPAEEPERSKE